MDLLVEEASNLVCPGCAAALEQGQTVRLQESLDQSQDQAPLGTDGPVDRILSILDVVWYEWHLEPLLVLHWSYNLKHTRWTVHVFHFDFYPNIREIDTELYPTYSYRGYRPATRL